MTTAETSTSLAQAVDTYLASLGEPDPERRATLIAEAWEADSRYVDPPRDISGQDAMQATIAAVQQNAPGVTFRRTSGIDAHHEYARFSWEMVGADGSVALTGLDVAVVSPDGKLREIIGFFGDLPAA